MNQTFTKNFRIPSLLLAATLQMLPIVRAALPVTQNAANIIVILFRWAAGGAATLGGVQAVSGASTVITNPRNVKGTNGRPFSLRLTTAPDQAHFWRSDPLPTGLALTGTSGSALWRIEGTPVVDGTFNVRLTAKDQANSPANRTVTATLVLNIVSLTNSPPSITTQPTNRIVTAGQNTTLAVVAGGTTPLSYRWRFGGNTLPNATNSTLTLTNVGTGQAGSYDVVITNIVGGITSAVATLTVNLPVVAPAITTQPQDNTVTAGQDATFTVVATGTAPLQYFWRKGTTVLAANTNPSFTILNAQMASAGSYSVIVSNSAGTASSSAATLTVNPLPQPPSISSQPTNQTVVQGANTSFIVVAGGAGPLSYQWRFAGNDLNGETNFMLALNNVSTGQAGGYDVVITNTVGSVTSSVATLAVNLAVLAPAITTQLQNQTVTAGQDTTFSVTATGTAPLYYLWRKGTAVFAVNTDPAFTITGAGIPDAGSYSVIVSNSAGTVTSLAALLTVNPVPPPVFTAGTYNGLFYDSNNIQHASSGFFTVAVRSSGDFTARLQNGTKKFSFKGRFDQEGRTTNQVLRTGSSALTVQWSIDLHGSNRITGHVTDGLWSSELLAHRAVFHATTNPAAGLAGKYTLLIPGTMDGSTAPLGDGFGSLNVDSAGSALLTGTMADGSRATQRVGLSGAGDWPLYVPLYAGKGSVFGWLRVRPANEIDLDGVAHWIRPPGRAPKFYTNGFFLVSTVAGSIYTPPVGGIIETNSALVILNGGNLAEASTNAVTLAAGGRVINAGPNQLTFTVTPTTGLFKGTVKLPTVTRPIRFQGAILRGMGMGGGYFLGTNEIGNVYFGP